MKRSGVFRIFLSDLQSAQFQQALDEAKELTGVCGIFCTVSRRFNLENGRLGLELQVAKLDPASTRKIQAILTKASDVALTKRCSCKGE
jgi:hypothetical protein